MKKTKYFDSKIYELEKNIKALIIILIVFIMGFMVGYWTKNKEYEEKLYENAIEITNLKESIDRLEQMKKLK